MHLLRNKLKDNVREAITYSKNVVYEVMPKGRKPRHVQLVLFGMATVTQYTSKEKNQTSATKGRDM